MVTPFDSMCATITVVEKLVKCLNEEMEKLTEVGCPRKSQTEINSRERKKRKITEDVNLESRKSLNDAEMRNEVLVTENGASLGVAQAEAYPRASGEMESGEQSLRIDNESRERKVDEMIRKLNEQVSAVEEREKNFNCFVEKKTRAIELQEDNLRLKVEEEKLREIQRLKYVNEIAERLRSAENKLEGVSENLGKRLEEIEYRENVAFESAALSLKEAELIRESLEKQMEEFERVKDKFNSFQGEKLRELESKEQLLNEIKEKAVKDAELLNEKLKKQLEVLEKKRSNFNSFEEKKMEELYAKENCLNKMSEKIGKDAKLWNENLITHERSINQLLKRLMLDKDIVENLKEETDQRYKILFSKEKEINSTSDWVEKRMDEADSKAQKLVVKQKRVNKMKKSVIRKKCELREKEKKLDAREQALQAWQVELNVKQKELDSAQELNKQRLEKLDAREKSMKELTGKCFKEHRAIKKELLVEKDLVEKVARFLGVEEENFKDAIRELQHSADNSNGHHVRKELDESPDLKFTVRMDGKNLQMFLNDPEKDLVAMGDEVFKVFHLSSDPTKLVLDAMVGFYPPHLREGDTTLGVRKTCIALLKQLMNMSREIKPSVREEAMQVAFAWKSKMRASAETLSSLETLGFLLLLAVYDLASSFNKDEISTLLVMVSRHREEAPDLYRLVGCTGMMTLTENNPSQPSNVSSGLGLDKATQCSITYQVSPRPLSSTFVSP